jgi:intracellular sulfur oxidation DsrE/DsrF family protein
MPASSVYLGVGTALAALVLSGLALAQSGAAETHKHRIVFELTSDNPEHWDAVLNNIENLRKALGPENTQVELVAHGPGLGMLLASNEKSKDRMRKLASPSVVFASCENTMRRKNIRKEDLLDFVITVDSGVAEVIRKQEQGWSYIRSAD